MKSAGELLDLVPHLTHSDVNNYRRLGYLTSVRHGKNQRNHVYSEQAVLELRTAKALILEGLQTGRAFARATEQFEKNADRIREFVAESAERRNGYGPTPDEVERALRGDFPDVGLHLRALMENQSLAASANGQLLLLSNLKTTAMLAYSTQSESAFRVLSDQDRVRLRELAFDKYRERTRDLPESQRLPAPLDFIEEEGFSVTRLTLDPSVGGYSDPETKAIFLSRSIRRGSTRERLILAHEYWHLVLGHNTESADTERKTVLEAQATYAAVHYLIPIHTFNITVDRVEYGIRSPKERLRALAKIYNVSDSIIRQYRTEVAALPVE